MGVSGRDVRHRDVGGGTWQLQGDVAAVDEMGCGMVVVGGCGRQLTGAALVIVGGANGCERPVTGAGMIVDDGRGSCLQIDAV